MHLRGNLMLLMAAFIWGTTFVAQLVGMAGLGPFAFSFARYLLGLIFLVGLVFAFRGQRQAARRAGTYRQGYVVGLGAGVIMLGASSFQQYAMLYTSAGKTAFITALYLVFVPLASVLLGRKLHIENWVGALLALVGLYLLSVQGEAGLGIGDLLLLICSFFWTAHILFVDRFAALVDPIEVSMTQVGVCMAGSLVLALGFEDLEVRPMLDAWLPIFYSGVLSAGVAFTLQIAGQKYTDPAEAAIFMSFESVFGALGGALLLGERMLLPQVIGCALMFTGMIVTQIRPFLLRKRSRSPQRGSIIKDTGECDAPKQTLVK